MRDINEMKKKADRAPYAKPEITTLSTEQIIEELGPASANYGDPTGGTIP